MYLFEIYSTYRSTFIQIEIILMLSIFSELFTNKHFVKLQFMRASFFVLVLATIEVLISSTPIHWL